MPMLTARARRLVVLLAALTALVLAGCVGLVIAPAAQASGAQNRVRAFTPAAQLPAGPAASQSSCVRPGSILSGAGATAGFCVAAKGAGGLGDLTQGEVGQIQGVVDQAGRPLEVAGSAAKAERRGVGSNLPIGKGPGTRSDIDYLIPPGSRSYYQGLEGQLPGMDPFGPIPGTHNPFIGPGIRFEPGAPPRYIPGAPQ